MGREGGELGLAEKVSGEKWKRKWKSVWHREGRGTAKVVGWGGEEEVVASTAALSITLIQALIILFTHTHTRARVRSCTCTCTHTGLGNWNILKGSEGNKRQNKEAARRRQRPPWSRHRAGANRQKLTIRVDVHGRIRADRILKQINEFTKSPSSLQKNKKNKTKNPANATSHRCCLFILYTSHGRQNIVYHCYRKGV